MKAKATTVFLLLFTVLHYVLKKYVMADAPSSSITLPYDAEREATGGRVAEPA